MCGLNCSHLVSCLTKNAINKIATRLVNSVLNLPDGQVMFFEKFKLKKNCEINSARQKASGAS